MAQIDPVFQKNLEKQQADSLAAAQAAQLQAQRTWMLPPLGNWLGNIFDITGISGAFDRTALNEMYTTDLNKPATVADTMGAKLQINYLSASERAFRLQNASPTRSRPARGRPAGGSWRSGRHFFRLDSPICPKYHRRRAKLDGIATSEEADS